MLIQAAAWLFLAAAVAVACLHLILILGAPIGFMTMGGRNPGVLPASARGASAFQAVLILYLALIVLQAAALGSWSVVPTDRWALWIVVAISALSLVANTITPSKRERYFGIPATLCLVFGSTVVAFGT